MSARQLSRRAALRELARAFPGRTTALAALAALSGALPAAFAALVGVLVSQLPAVARHGFGSPAGHRVIWTWSRSVRCCWARSWSPARSAS